MHPKSYSGVLVIKQQFFKKSELSLCDKTVKDRTVKISSNITYQQIEDLKLVSALSIAVDEFCDITDTPQVSHFIRCILSNSERRTFRITAIERSNRWRGYCKCCY